MAIVFFASLVILAHVSVVTSVSAKENNYFKVPLDVREANRPKRLVDDKNDPDLVALKNLQDKFFTIVQNSSAGQDFKTFNQVLKLIDSEAGVELGRLLMKGFMLGFGKENSNVLFMEFLDDFKYRVSPELADALYDYKDFMKTVDLKLIPLTIQTLFQKDELGNSLAQIPLGQLVDMVQPEASKYGIDIKGLINGILGKGDSSFPDLVNKILHNFNATTLLKGITESAMYGNELVPQDNVDAKKAVGQIRRPKKDPTLLLFKPLIVKLLKENDIDLDADAVIQVITPYVTGGGELLKSIFPGDEKGGFNIAQFAPLIGLLAAYGGTDKSSGGKDKGPDFLQAAMSIMSTMGSKKNVDVNSILNMASQFLKDPKSSSKNEHDAEDELDNLIGIVSQLSQGLEEGNLLQMVSLLMGSSEKREKGGASVDNEINPANLLRIAANLLESVNSNKLKEKSNVEGKPRSKKSKNLTDAIGSFLLKLQLDKKCHTKIKDAITLAKAAITNALISVADMKKLLPSFLASQSGGPFPYEKINFDVIFNVLSYSQDEWKMFIKQLNVDTFREKVIKAAAPPAVELVDIMVTDSSQKMLNEIIKGKLGEALNSMGLNSRGLTVSNFADRLKPLAEMVSKGWDLPVNLGSLIDPLRNTIKETVEWYSDFIARVKRLRRAELEPLVALSLEQDFADSILDVASASQITSSSCLPREVCDVINDVSLHHPESLKLSVTRLASIIYAGIRSSNEDNFILFLQVTRAATIGDACEKYFPIKCEKTVPSQKEERQRKEGEQREKEEEERDEAERVKTYKYMHDDL